MRLKNNSGYLPTHKPGRFGQHGMTLMEVMITVAIVGILAAIAYPSYETQIRKSRRAEGKALVLEAQARQERFFTENNTYSANMAGLGYAATEAGEDNNTIFSENDWYQVSTAAPTATSFTLTATPRLAQLASDTDCANFTINQLGVKGVSGTHSANPENCW